MGYGIKRLKEIEEERKRKREERARIKAEKEKKKKEEKKLARKKRLKKKQNQKYYAKVKAAREAYHEAMGDEKGVFSIYLMKDGKRQKFFGSRRYKVAALQMYHKLLEENKKSIVFPMTRIKAGRVISSHKYELLLVKKMDETKDNPISSFRNKDGKFSESFIIDATTHKILDKNDWLIEESFHVYGYNPKTDRKNFTFIYDNIIKKNLNEYTRIIAYNNKLIHHYEDDFDMIVCKDKLQASELYDAIEKRIQKEKIDTILFMGRVSSSRASWLVDEIEEKTGWPRSKCVKVS